MELLEKCGEHNDSLLYFVGLYSSSFSKPALLNTKNLSWALWKFMVKYSSIENSNLAMDLRQDFNAILLA